MLITRLRLRNFRSYAAADVVPGARLTVVHGPNGAGKTNLLEGLYFACTARSCRTTSDREVVRFGAPAARAQVEVVAPDGTMHELAVGLQPGDAKRLRADGAPAQRLLDVPFRPLVAVFLPDRLELVKGPPALRRAHLDQLVAALWPARAATRRAYGRALAQRNALLARVRAGGVGRGTLRPWDLELARHAIALRDDRARAVSQLAGPFADAAAQLGVQGAVQVGYRPRSQAVEPEQLAAELAERLDGDLVRGFTGHGPHRDDLALLREGRELRVYGSQGEQRLGLLALLLAEREVLGTTRGHPPLLLLDDVMSELDGDRRGALAGRLAREGGQSVITTTDPAQVPHADAGDVVRIAVRDGVALSGAPAGERAA